MTNPRVSIVKDITVERAGVNVRIIQRFSLEKMDDVICIELDDVPALIAALNYEIEDHSPSNTPTHPQQAKESAA